ncbi:nuclear factor erythroid 2-related factor 2a [Siniperca chuatsi]|uniref:Nuclear factor erythroid 2-related factor 2 n=1 Tax=Siniperca chuatsi TaxID=119488 RepID=A0A7G9TMK7_SINCH|nr:nuclear factor erythroid 2-related factor 2a [Siniperca chuatsi]QNN81342.1 nuclear factor erythroid 2-related factor 2 [Siniperca chuatsi]
MMMEMEAMHSSQQDMNLIDILWKQDIDLGARREVFDYNHRQKEHELQRQRELEEEKRQHLVREQEKALLAQLQLDEETGEYIPCPPSSAPLQSAVTPLEVTQNVSFAEETGDAMSFDECLQLLAETFPVEETENTSVCLDTTAVAPMMSPEQPAMPVATLSPGPPPPPPPQRMSPDLEQAWMELLSLPELQQCLNMQMEDTLETTTYPLPNSPEVQNPNYTFYPMTSLTDGETNNVNVCPAEFMNTFDGSIPSMAPPDNLSQTKAKAPQLNTNFTAESYCDIFYPNAILEESSGQHGLEVNESNTVPHIPNKPPFTPVDLYSLSPGDAFDRGKQNLTAELPDSDSGISSNTSPNASSPGKSVYEDGSFLYSDSDMEEMDQNPGSAESDYSEMFSLNFQPDDLQPAAVSVLKGQPQHQKEKKPKQHKTDPGEEIGHNNAPFTKDKRKKRSEVRLSRDEQRAKALKIPFTVAMIINLPVDDFNEMMSKHQLNEAQLALVRDIRRRGKNKVAAQNCRKRKMENIVGLESELDSLKDEKERLLSEKSQNITNMKEMKQQLNSLYLEVFSMLRDEKGNTYSPSDYSLQQSTDGSIFLVPRIKKTFIKSEDKLVSPL